MSISADSLLLEGARRTGLPVDTEVMEEAHIKLALDAGVACLQIGARNALNYSLLRAVGRDERIGRLGDVMGVRPEQHGHPCRGGLQHVVTSDRDQAPADERGPGQHVEGRKLADDIHEQPVGSPGTLVVAARHAVQGETAAGCFSRDPENTRRTGRALYLDPERCYPSYQEMADREKALPPERRIDFVSIVTPNNMHFPVARAFLEAGLQ